MSLPEDMGRDRKSDLRRLAFLVDGDNATAKLLKEMLAEASKYGAVIIRNMYGDWTSSQLGPWKVMMQEHAMDPIQQFANVSGKNATDSKMIIDAMDILHEGVAGGFCLVSSDSDYTALARRIRKAGLFVMGIGRAGTPIAFQRACDIFVATENLVPPPPPVVEDTFPTDLVEPPPPPLEEGTLPVDLVESAPPPPVATSETAPRVDPSGALELLKRAFDSLDEGDGMVHLANLGVALYRLDPAFDSRTYGKAKLVDLVQAFPDVFTVDRLRDLGPGAVYVRKRNM